jgi:hypothetical protein
MKTSWKNYSTLCALAFLIATPQTFTTHHEPIDYDNAYALMLDFLDLSVKADKPMNYWVKQFMGIIRKKGDTEVQSLAPFLRDFNTALRSRQPALIGLAFERHKEKFGEPELTKYMKEQLNKPNGLTTITNILKARLMK